MSSLRNTRVLTTMAVALLWASPSFGSEPGWDGWHLGVGLGTTSSQVDGRYSHRHIGNCVNLNFGSEWPGDGCEGNQDYQYDFGPRESSLRPVISLERLWSRERFTYGWHLGLRGGTAASYSQRKILSNTWGDTLDVNVRMAQTAQFRGIWGAAQADWLSFATLGIALQRAQLDFLQDQPGYKLPVSKAESRWAFGGVVGVGVRKRIDADWSLTAELLHQSLRSFDVSTTGVTLSGGIRYPDTTVKVDAAATTLAVGVSRRF